MQYSSYSLYSKKYFSHPTCINKKSFHSFTYNKKSEKRNIFRIDTDSFSENFTTVTKMVDTSTAREAHALEKEKHVTNVEMKGTKGEASLETLMGASKRAEESDDTALQRLHNTGQLPGEVDDYVVKTDKIQPRVVTTEQDLKEKADTKGEQLAHFRKSLSSEEALQNEQKQEEEALHEEIALQNEEAIK